ncbi:MAG: molybdate ABC transporter permease subunit [Acidobacteria bacterium]|nr:molybdate ABC transporter permease subunit [Acidobacteriota bacterium]MBI3264295.1 molybdate ABC transporter permease subunit [Acidobacteriota bacterium]
MPDESLLRITVFTVLVAAAATVVMLPIGVSLAWLLARRRFRAKALLDTLVTVPLVMPPVATGLILLRLLGARSPLGRALEMAGLEIVFTWKAVLLAMAVMGLPLVVRTVRAGLQQVPPRYEQIAETLGAGPLRVFFTITLPLASRSVVAGAILGFSRALGEFGATIMVAGSIPGRTRTLASAIYAYTETGRDAQAATLVAIAIVVAFAAVWLSNHIADRDSGLGPFDSRSA